MVEKKEFCSLLSNSSSRGRGEEMELSLEGFKDYVQNRDFQEKTKQYKKLIETLEPYINEGNVKYFYPYNLFNENEKKFFLFAGNYFVVVTLQEDGKIFVKNTFLKPDTISLEIPPHPSEGLILCFKNELGEEIVFNSLKDSNAIWNVDYIELITKIYKYLTEYR